MTDVTISSCLACHPELTSLLGASLHLLTATFKGVSDINEVVEFLAATQPNIVQSLPCPCLEKLDLASVSPFSAGRWYGS